MTTQQAFLAMKLGCKIRADWMKPGLFYYIKGDSVCCADAIPPGFIKVSEFCTFFEDEEYDWYTI